MINYVSALNKMYILWNKTPQVPHSKTQNLLRILYQQESGESWERIAWSLPSSPAWIVLMFPDTDKNSWMMSHWGWIPELK